MHYANGRPAKNGDKVVLIPSWGTPMIGILYDAQAGNDYCNGKLAPIATNDPLPNLKECLHLDDVLQALGNLDQVKTLIRREPTQDEQQASPATSETK